MSEKLLKAGSMRLDKSAYPFVSDMDGILSVTDSKRFIPLRDANTPNNLRNWRKAIKDQYIANKYTFLGNNGYDDWAVTSGGTMYLDTDVKEYDSDTDSIRLNVNSSSAVTARRPFATAINLIGYTHVRLWVNTSDLDHITTLRLGFDSGNSSNGYNINVLAQLTREYGSSEMTFARSNFSSYGTTPSWSNITRIYLVVQTDGTEVNINISNIEMVNPKPKNSKFVFRIDDGLLSVYEHAMPILKKYNVPATLFVNPDFIKSGEHGESPSYGGLPTMSLEELKYCHSLGWSVCSHSFRHNFFDDEHNGKYSQAYSDLSATQDWLVENGFGNGAFSHVFGNHLRNKYTAQAAYDIFLTDYTGKNQYSDFTTLPWSGNSIVRYQGEGKTMEALKDRIDALAGTRQLGVFYFHRFEETDSGDAEILSEAFLEEFIQYVVSKSGLDVVTAEDLIECTPVALR